MKNTLWQKWILFWKTIRNKNTPISLKLLCIAAIIYGVSPLDLIPDAIPLLGLLDDAIVLYGVISYIWKQTIDIRKGMSDSNIHT